jgi:SpoIID/LytB domain protein
MIEPMKHQPKIMVGIIDQQVEVSGRLNGNFHGDGFIPVSGLFSAKELSGRVALLDGKGHEITRSPMIRLSSQQGSTLTLFQVTVGNRFHWEKKEDQTFRGDLILQVRKDGTMVAIDEIPLEDYLISVISSEMKSTAPMEFLKAHAILARSWVLAALDHKKKGIEISRHGDKVIERKGEVVRWYGREDHDLFDVCADDHCQRYQGMTKIVSQQAEEAVLKTRGMVITYQDQICDARYSKACGGMTESFDTAWEDKNVPYLTSIPDMPLSHQPIRTEEEASRWILSKPNAYCHTEDNALIGKILPDLDFETKSFFRWKVQYSRSELEEILREKSGLDFGSLKQIIPVHRGPSGRISRLKIIGSKQNMVVGKELEIRRWLSWSHLYSSAFIVTVDATRFIFHGAGWGHGVGLCQIGAAVMATQGFSAGEILKHYFQGVEIKKIY